MRKCIQTIITLLALIAGTAHAPMPAAQEKLSKRDRVPLTKFSTSTERLVSKVSPAVVQINTAGFGPVEGSSEGLVASQHGTGSGVILDPNGYIITNAHVVEGARRIQVLIAVEHENRNAAASILTSRGKVVPAKLVGADSESDLAVLKIEQTNLPTLEFADSDKVRQGQLVFAFGSPLGLQNSVSMGVISSVSRQLRPYDTMIYLQTDAPINPGNSGGPLVDVQGRLIGINTLIITQSGGSEGIGFAAPSNIVKNVYDQLKKDGHVHRGYIGIITRAVSPTLAAGLHLPRDWGLIVEDISPESPAALAGLQVGDLLLTVDDKLIANARQFEVNLYQHTAGDPVKFEVLRGKERVSLTVTLKQRSNDPFRFVDFINREENLIPQWGIFVLPLNEDITEMLPSLRKPAGVLVGARVMEPGGIADLQSGDLICELNGEPVRDLDGLKTAILKLHPGDPVVLQIQRQGQLMYVTFEMP